MDVLAVYRLRWQIELAFKRLKSLLRMDPPADPAPDRASRSSLTPWHISFWPCCATITQPGVPCDLSPEDLLDARLHPFAMAGVGYSAAAPCCWRSSVALTVDGLLRADPNVHRRLAHARRKRKPQVRYPLRR